ncbi:unnamed protein product [Calypogeia fissa]
MLGTQSSINQECAAPRTGPGIKRPRKPRTRKVAGVEDNPGSEPGTGAKPKASPNIVCAGKENVPQDTRPHKPRQRKSRAAPPFSVDVVKEQIVQSSVLKQPLTPLQENLISSVRCGSAQA